VRGAVETEGAEMGAAVGAEVEISGADEFVPDETVWAEAEDESAAAARMLIRSFFTGRLSIPNRFRRGRNRERGRAYSLY
jgi:hypothetical protein